MLWKYEYGNTPKTIWGRFRLRELVLKNIKKKSTKTARKGFETS
jgi:hypothetical protein